MPPKTMEEQMQQGGGDVNPLKSDPELQVLLKKLDGIKKYKKFQGWKNKFLLRLDQFLYESGMKPAEKASNDFDSLLNTCISKHINKVKGFIERGELGNDKKTVKAALSFNEMCKYLEQVRSEIETLIPSTNREEKRKKFTKFHLGAQLIRQGFHQYKAMKDIEDALEIMGEQLKDVADRQQHDLFTMYNKQVQRFCDIMADLNLYEVMMKCLQFAEEPDDESEEPEPINITIKSSDGRILKLELDPTETIGNIKDAISAGCEITPDRQILKFRGDTLKDNSATLESLGIENGAIMTVEPIKIPITVKTWDGKTIKMNVDPLQYLTEFKKDLEKESGMPARNQVLYRGGNELDDDLKNLQDLGISGGTILDLEPRTITVNVTMPDGTEAEVELKPSDTVAVMKEKIEATTGMPASKQVLSHNGKELPDDGERTVRHLGIREGSPIKVSIYKVPVTVKTWDGKTIKAMVDPTDYLSEVKRQLEGDSDVPARNQRLFLNGQELKDDNKRAGDYGIQPGTVLELEPKSIKVMVEMPNGKTEEVEIGLADTADDIKKKIEEKTGMAAPTQVLEFNGKELPGNGATVASMGLREKSPIKVSVFKVPVTVTTLDGEKIKVNVDPTAKLGEIKKQLEAESGIPAANQNLFINGKLLGDDSKAAKDYGIQAGSELDLEPKSIKVSVQMPDGTTKEVEIAPKDTSDEIKKKIEQKTGMKAPRQVLKVNGSELPQGKTAKDMGIREGTPIKVEVFKVPITVNTMDGRQIKAMIDPTAKLGEIKKQLEAEGIGTPAKDQKLSMNGKELADDSKSAGDHGVKAGSVLEMQPKSIKVVVEMPDGQKREVEISPADTAEDMKKRIEKETGMKAPRQVLKDKNGKELPTGKTAYDMGIQDGDPIKVGIFKIPITITTMDGRQVQVWVEPGAKLGDIKKQLEDELGVPASNQRLFMNDTELADDNKTAAEHGIKKGSKLNMEPKKLKVKIEMPDGEVIEVEIKPTDQLEGIKEKVEAKTTMAAERQVLKYNGKKIDIGKTVREMQIPEGALLKCEIFKIPITVKTHEGKIIPLNVEPTGSIRAVKKLLEAETGMEIKKQLLRFQEEEIKDDKKTVHNVGIRPGQQLSLEPHVDGIVFVDIKCGTLFGLDREIVIQKEALTPIQGNATNFMETNTEGATREKLLQAMMESPSLKFNPNVVVQKGEVDEYDLAEAAEVQNKWGVKLKKREKNKKGEEFFFIDTKTGAVGELSRQKYIDMGFITPEGTGLKESEKNVQTYDKFVNQIRKIFGVSAAT